MKLKELVELIPYGQIILIKSHKDIEFDADMVVYVKKTYFFDDRERLDNSDYKYLMNKEVKKVKIDYEYDFVFKTHEDYMVIEVEDNKVELPEPFKTAKDIGLFNER